MAGSSFVSPTGYVDLDNDCEYSIDLKSTRGREYIDPKEDLAFYFNTYLVPKYGLNDINVNNTASFMKELQMNWSKLDVGLKDKVLDIMVDGIFTDSDFDFKNRFLQKLGVDTNKVQQPRVVSTKGPTFSKSTFGSNSQNYVFFGVGLLLLVIVLFLLNKKKVNNIAAPRLF
jgi:hypothetical protein